MNYFDWKHADGQRNVNAEYLYDELDKREIPIVIMEPLQGGRLANPAESVVNRLKERDPKASLASWAFRFVGSYPRILTVLSGMVYQEHLEDNLRTFKDFKYLTDEEKEFLGTEIAGIMASFPTINCNDLALTESIFREYSSTTTNASTRARSPRAPSRRITASCAGPIS